jgi:hypothetical protein
MRRGYWLGLPMTERLGEDWAQDGWDAFTFTVLEHIPRERPEPVFKERERWWIELYRSQCVELYNVNVSRRWFSRVMQPRR